MNKQLMHIIRFFLGGYIIFIGIRLLIQVTDQDPSNRILLSAIATILSLAGAVSMIYSGRKLWLLLKPEDNSVKDTEEGSEDSVARERAAAKRRGMNPMVDISDPLRSKEKEGSAGEKEDTLQQEQTGQREQPAEHRADSNNEADAGTDDQQDGAEYVRQTADRKHSMRLDSVEREEELEREEKQESKAEPESEDEPDTEEDSGLEDDDETDAEIIEELETDYEEM